MENFQFSSRNKGETAENCGKIRKTLTTHRSGGDIMVSDYWLWGELPSFACEIRGITADFCEDVGVGKSF